MIIKGEGGPFPSFHLFYSCIFFPRLPFFKAKNLGLFTLFLIGLELSNARTQIFC